MATCCSVGSADESANPVNRGSCSQRGSSGQDTSCHRVIMLPGRFLRPGDIFEMDTQDIGQRTEAGNRYLLTVVHKASKFLFAFPLPTKETLGVARALLDLIFTFGLPVLLRSYPGTEFTTELVGHLCQWMNESIHYGLTGHARAQGTTERLGVWLREVLRGCARPGRAGEMSTYSQQCKSTAPHLTRVFPVTRLLYGCFSEGIHERSSTLSI